jgi:hypothetical protein
MCIHPEIRTQPRRRLVGGSSSSDDEQSSPSSILGSSPSGRTLKKTPSFLKVVDAVKPAFDAKKKMRQLHNDAVVLKVGWNAVA